MIRIGRQLFVLGSNRGVLGQERVLRGNSVQTCNISTLDSMYEKMISLPAVHYIEDSLVQFHDVTGIPWYGTIILCTASLRLMISLPAQTTSQKVASKRFLLFKEMEEIIIPSLRRATDKQVLVNRWTKEKAVKSFNRVAAQIKSQKVIEYNCHMSKLFIPLYVQIPVWVFTSIGIRNLALMRETQERFLTVPVQERYIQLAAEGALWFPNLTVPDISLILPFIVGSSFALNIFISSCRIKSSEKTETKYSKVITYFLYAISALMVPLAALQPSALALYWATSGVVGVGMNLLLLSPTYRKLVKIPKISKDSETPYVDLKENMLAKLTFKRRE